MALHENPETPAETLPRRPQQQSIDLKKPDVTRAHWEAPTTAVRDMFSGFEDNILADCDDMDKILKTA
ncbi:uncharacterized protein N7487_010328 [Penicillium crustosum]|uniref:uncharacterized protein n=1 Tax=Penicillium crustosum TaxID=36656 RepID=UPI002388916F|nr:uncharacterized protein N7487_010328 [Penicillium crustosum]KAJ5396025.1 hypothetical protein N7487_010328 [Penicillium crustosum]